METPVFTREFNGQGWETTSTACKELVKAVMLCRDSVLSTFGEAGTQPMEGKLQKQFPSTADEDNFDILE
ncbi:unnamed protein product [Angiostrongylus costaricensis]|uniref:Phage protein n=1 Tax=Angiostrongylus costaricensis TaxID=334426 RepID=A0A0R3Q173_ANGCS|nr:unnamed protein product [Angiostrongylus costaricensis]